MLQCMCKYGGVAEQVQASDLKSAGEITSNLGVRVPSPLPQLNCRTASSKLFLLPMLANYYNLILLFLT